MKGSWTIRRTSQNNKALILLFDDVEYFLTNLNHRRRKWTGPVGKDPLDTSHLVVSEIMEERQQTSMESPLSAATDGDHPFAFSDFQLIGNTNQFQNIILRYFTCTEEQINSPKRELLSTTQLRHIASTDSTEKNIPSFSQLTSDFGTFPLVTTFWLCFSLATRILCFAGILYVLKQARNLRTQHTALRSTTVFLWRTCFVWRKCVLRRGRRLAKLSHLTTRWPNKTAILSRNLIWFTVIFFVSWVFLWSTSHARYRFQPDECRTDLSNLQVPFPRFS